MEYGDDTEGDQDVPALSESSRTADQRCMGKSMMNYIPSKSAGVDLSTQSRSSGRRSIDLESSFADAFNEQCSLLHSTSQEQSRETMHASSSVKTTKCTQSTRLRTRKTWERYIPPGRREKASQDPQSGNVNVRQTVVTSVQPATIGSGHATLTLDDRHARLAECGGDASLEDGFQADSFSDDLRRRQTGTEADVSATSSHQFIDDPDPKEYSPDDSDGEALNSARSTDKHRSMFALANRTPKQLHEDGTDKVLSCIDGTIKPSEHRGQRRTALPHYVHPRRRNMMMTTTPADVQYCADSIMQQSSAQRLSSSAEASKKTGECKPGMGGDDVRDVAECTAHVGRNSGEGPIGWSDSADVIHCDAMITSEGVSDIQVGTELHNETLDKPERTEEKAESSAEPEIPLSNPNDPTSKSSCKTDERKRIENRRPYVPPGRRATADVTRDEKRSDSSYQEGRGPLWTSTAIQANVRGSERLPANDGKGDASPSRPAPARASGAVSGGMSAYGANISEYSDVMSREQLEACTACITNFPSALPPGQREVMLEPFISLGALLVWPHPAEALATFATPALARQAVSAKSNRSSVLIVELLSATSPQRRRRLEHVKLARPGRPPADASSAARLISGALGIRHPRKTDTKENGTKNSKNSSRDRSIRRRGSGRAGKHTQAEECTDSWDM